MLLRFLARGHSAADQHAKVSGRGFLFEAPGIAQKRNTLIFAEMLRAVVEIPLVNTSYVAIVDDEDCALVSSHRWFKTKGGTPGRCYYAKAKIRLPEFGRMARLVFMHSFLIGKKDGFQIDHKNCNGLDNRRDNLRWATPSQNSTNRDVADHGLSSYRGVYLLQGRWRATIGVERKRLHLGLFLTEEEAAIAYDEAAIRLHGEFARLNFPVHVVV